jgi:hypothetical protein
MEDQLTKRPICSLCKTEELTNEEVALYKDGRGSCWFCVADTYIQMNIRDQIPPPEKYGRPGESIDAQVERSKNKHFKQPIDAAAVANGTAPAPGHVAPSIPGQTVHSLKLTEQERKDFTLAYGTDPVPKVKPTEIIVHGATEDTYIKFSIPLPIDAENEKEIKRLMTGMLDIWGKLLKYGPQFASTLIELQAQNPEMYLGGRGK